MNHNFTNTNWQISTLPDRMSNKRGRIWWHLLNDPCTKSSYKTASLPPFIFGAPCPRNTLTTAQQSSVPLQVKVTVAVPCATLVWNLSSTPMTLFCEGVGQDDLGARQTQKKPHCLEIEAEIGLGITWLWGGVKSFEQTKPFIIGTSENCFYKIHVFLCIVQQYCTPGGARAPQKAGCFTR